MWTSQATNWTRYGMYHWVSPTTANSTITSTNSGTTTQRPQLVVTYVY